MTRGWTPMVFWGRAAKDLPWLKKWDRVFEWNYPTFRWFSGGQTNLAYSALDHHVKRGWGGHTALIYVNERGERRIYTYAQLRHQVERAAAALRGMGIKKGDLITSTCRRAPKRSPSCSRPSASARFTRSSLPALEPKL